MLKKYQKGFLDIIQASNYDITDFKREISDEDLEFGIRYKDSPFVFYVSTSYEDFHKFDYQCTLFEPTYPLESNLKEDDDYINIETVYKYFKSWLETELKKYVDEINTPDFWEYYQNNTSYFSNLDFDSNDYSHFSENEIKQIRISIQEISKQIKHNYKLDELQNEIVDFRLDYLSESLDRLNKFDFKSVLYTTLISIIIALSLDVEKGRELFVLCKNLFVSVVHLLK